MNWKIIAISTMLIFSFIIGRLSVEKIDCDSISKEEYISLVLYTDSIQAIKDKAKVDIRFWNNEAETYKKLAEEADLKLQEKTNYYEKIITDIDSLDHVSIASQLSNLRFVRDTLE